MHHKLCILYRISIFKFVVLGLTALSTLSYCLTHTVAQATSLEVVAIVNDEIISSIDLDQRIKLSRLGSQTQDSEKVKNIVRDNALESLINEAVISQELRTLGLKIPKSSIDKAVSSIEKRNRIPSGKLGTILAQNNIAMEALIQQVQGELGLMIIAQHLFGKKVLINNLDIETALLSRIQDAQQSLFPLQELVLRADTPKRRQESTILAENIIAALQTQNAPFEAAVGRFSIGLSAQNGGNLGLVNINTLPEEIREPLLRAQPNSLVGPIFSQGSVYLFRLGEAVRDPLVASLNNMKIDVVKLSTPKGEELSTFIQDHTPQHICNLSSPPQNISMSKQENISLTQLPRHVRIQLSILDVGDSSRPYLDNADMISYILCNKSNTESAVRELNQLRENMAQNRLRILADRHRMTLRREARVVIR
ncbi:MAG: peptidylprolyl isomerase [Alphaproteobacteria bacterium]